MSNPNSPLADVQPQALADLLARAVERGVSSALMASTVKSRQVNVPAVQHVVGGVEVRNLAGVLAGLKRLELAIVDNETDLGGLEEAMGDVLKAVREIKFPEAPEVQKVTVENQVEIPKEIKASVDSLPKYVREKFDALIQAVQEKELVSTTHVDAPDLSAFLRELSPLKGAMDSLGEEIRDWLDRAEKSGRAAEKEGGSVAKLLKEVKKSIDNIPVPVFRMPLDSQGNVAVSDMARLVVKPFDQIVATYPNSTTEVYTYKKATVAHTVVTVVYTDLTKAVLSSVTVT